MFALICQDREAVLAHFHELKQEMNSSREEERSRLTTLTLQSDAAMKELQTKKEKVSINYPLNVHSTHLRWICTTSLMSVPYCEALPEIQTQGFT